MTTHYTKLSVILVALLVCGCRDDIRVAAAEVQGEKPHALSARQVQFLNFWLEQHNPDWFKVLYTPPPGDLHVSVRTRGGESGTIEFLPQQNQKAVLVFWAKKPSKIRMASFDASDVDALRQELRSSQ